MLPGKTTGPGENQENLEQQGKEHDIVGEQVRKTRQFCEESTKDPTFKDFIKQFHQSTLTRDKLKEEFKKRLKTLSAENRAKMGIASDSDTDIEAFLSKTGCFENQFMYHIEHNQKLKDSAKDDMIQGAIDVVEDEYEGLTDTHKTTLRKVLKKESTKTIRSFLEIPSYRKKRLDQALASELKTKNLNDINFDTLNDEITKLPPNNANSRGIQDAWRSIMGGFKLEEGESMQDAIKRIQANGSEGNLSADYEKFFSDSNTLISKENKKRILGFLARQYLPLVTYDAVESVDPKAAKNVLNKYAPITSDIVTGDPEMDRHIREDRENNAKNEYITGLTETNIVTRNLPFETQVRLLGRFGSARKIEQQRNFWQGKPGSLRGRGVDYKNLFLREHGIHSQKVMTQSGFLAEITAKLGNKVTNLDKFKEGNVMVWRQKDKDGNLSMAGYYAIDSLLSEDLDEESVAKLRFLGNNKNPVSPAGMPLFYSGPELYHYLSGCSQDGTIDFIDGSELEQEVIKDGSKIRTDDEVKEVLREKFGSANIPTREALDKEVDELLYDGGKKLEAEKTEERKIHEGMIIALVGNENTFDTFQIKSITDPDPMTGEEGEVTLWDGWGSGERSIKNYTYSDFLNILKQQKETKKEVYRVPTGGKKFGIDQFNVLIGSEQHNREGRHKKYKDLKILSGEKGNQIGSIDEKSGVFQNTPIVRVGEKQDLYIESIQGEEVTLRIGTYKSHEFNKKTGKLKDASFKGTGSMTMQLSWLWGYLQSNNCTFEKPAEKGEAFHQEVEAKGGSMSWLNVFLHAHSWGTILHGDLWKAPYKAWEEQHHKDHAFAGKLTAALAMEKLQSGTGPISGILNWAEWPSIMVADGNGSFQSYLDELVNKIDGMGSYHRVRLIKKWSSYHFPDPKFMAAMFASFHNFSHLYPYDDGTGKDSRGKWHYYNNVRHVVTNVNEKEFPHHMPHEPYPVDSEGNMLTEIQMTRALFDKFQHPMLKNLGRRFQKYMKKGHESLKDGGVGNLAERLTMDSKLDWMMGSALGAKLTETVGGAIKPWLKEGYPTEISTMPYAAMLFASREQQMLPDTQESLREEFQDTAKVPMFVFMQNRNLGNIFRETGVAFAYTISPAVGKELQSLVDERAHGRGDDNKNSTWGKRFKKLWTDHGKAIMDKMTGMRDPMLNLMINDPVLFGEMMKDLPAEKRAHYEQLQKKSPAIKSYYDRLYKMQSSAAHSNIRGGAFYEGDHFRFRDSFDNGYPMFWIDWDGYIDANLEDGFTKGDGTKGDGIFNDMRGFFDKIPDMCKGMAEQMGFKGEAAKKYMDKMSQTIYEKNISGVYRLMNQAKFNTETKCSYYNVASMILGMADIRTLTKTGASPELNAIFADWKIKMEGVDATAKSIAASQGFAASIRYRTRMWKKFEKIVSSEADLRGKSVTELDSGTGTGKKAIKKPDVHDKISDILSTTEAGLRTDNTTPAQPQQGEQIQHSDNVPESHGQGQQGQGRGDDDDN